MYNRSVYARLYYIAGFIYQKKGEIKLSNDYYQKASKVIAARQTDNEYLYYVGMSLKALGNNEEGNILLRKIFNNLNQSGPAFFTQFEGEYKNKDKQIANNHYYAGLAYWGLGDEAKAAVEFNKAFEYNPSHVWNRIYLKLVELNQE